MQTEIGHPLQAGERSGASAEADVWRVLGQTESLAAFAAAWMTLVGRSAPDISGGVILLGAPQTGPYDVLARFPAGPEDADAALLEKGAAVLRTAIERRRPAVETSPDAAALIAYPLVFSEQLHGAVLVQSRADDSAVTRRLMRHLQWSAAGVEAFLGRRAHRDGMAFADRARFLIGLVDTLASRPHGVDAARALANALALRLACDSVAIGRYVRQRSRLVAVSQNATIERRNSLSRAIEAAQNEAIDQERILVAAGGDEGGSVATTMHERLARTLDGAQVVTLPLFADDKAIGAITLRRREPPFARDELDLLDAVAAASGPLLDEKWRCDRSVAALAWDRALGFFGKLLGPRHLALKAAAIALAAATGYLCLATDVYRVRAKAQIQGEMRRMVSAPFDGFIRAEFARAGDIVKEGAVLAELEDNDLELDRLRQTAKKRQYELELDKALAKRDLAEINISRAQINQTDAEIDLSEQMIARAKLRAPFAAVIVTGDLSQSVGRPVSRGDILFELAPLNRYRMNAVAPESEIGFVKPGQHGDLLLSALPGRTFPVEIGSITSVAQASEGVNGFEVIAQIHAADASFRPGMEGVVKIEVGRRNVAWIWFHPIIDWARIKLWSLIP